MQRADERPGGTALTDAAVLLCRAVVARSFGCTPEVAAHVAAQARLGRAPPRATIVWQGEAADGGDRGGGDAYLLVDGRAREVMVAAGGQLVPLRDYRSGDLFGELGLGGTPLASVVAVTTVDYGVFGGAVFVRLVETHACIGLALSRMLIARLSASVAKMVERSIVSAQGRVCAELLRRARAGGGRIAPPPVLATLAVDVQTTRETVSRTVAMLERRGLVRRDADALTVVAAARLEALVI